MAEKSQEEDKALKDKAVTYTQFDDLNDFVQDHQFYKDQKSFFSEHLNKMIVDPEEWHL